MTVLFLVVQCSHYYSAPIGSENLPCEKTEVKNTEIDLLANPQNGFAVLDSRDGKKKGDQYAFFRYGPSINYVVLVGGRGLAPKTIYYIDLT